MKKSVAEKLTARDPFVLWDCYANFQDLLQQQSWDLGWMHQLLTTNAIKISLGSQGNL